MTAAAEDGPVPLPPGVAGFGACGSCSFRRTGDAALCWECAERRLVVHPGPRCGVCDHPIEGAAACANYWCDRADRGFDVVWALGQYGPPLAQIIARYKYRGGRGWAVVLGRLITGYLSEHAPWFEEFDLIVACPGLPTPDRPWDHMALMLKAAAAADPGLWPFDLASPAAVVKTEPTVALMTVGSAESRRLWAAGDLRPALAVPDPGRVRGRQILVVDDVFTDGSTLREVALALRGAGAIGVSGLVLARQAWRVAHRPGGSRPD